MILGTTLFVIVLVAMLLSAAVLVALAIGAAVGLFGLAVALLIVLPVLAVLAMLGLGFLPLLLPFLLLYWLLRPRRRAPVGTDRAARATA
jgi:hypothetical protein